MSLLFKSWTAELAEKILTTPARISGIINQNIANILLCIISERDIFKNSNLSA